jgi:hypothetical protein
MSFFRVGRSAVGSVSVLLLAAALGGCGSSKSFVKVAQPKDGARFERGADVPARLTFGPDARGTRFRATLTPASGGAPSDVTSSFNPPSASPSGAEAVFKGLMPGRYELAVELSARGKKGAPARDAATFIVRQPRLAFNPPAPITLYAGTAASVTVDASFQSPNSTGIKLSSGDASVANTAGRVTIPAGSANSPKLRVSAISAGTAEVTASADGYDSTTVQVNVRPVVSGATPSGARPGNTVTIEGMGFVSGAAVRIGDKDAKTTFAAPNKLTAVVPAGVPAGAARLTVRARGQSSASVPFEVVGRSAAAESFTLVRTGSDDLQVYRYVPGEGFTETDDKRNLGAGSSNTIGVAYVGGMFVRADGSGVQRFDLSGDNVVPAGALGGAATESTGVAAGGATVLRATTAGLERYSVTGPQIAPVARGNAAGTASAVGAAVDVKGTIAVRAHGAGIDVYRVLPVGAPILVGSAPAGAASTRGGVGVCVAPGGTRAVRSHATGIDVYSIAADGKPTRVGTSNDGGPSDTPSAVAVNASGTRAFRAHASGIEVYDITGTGTPKRLGGQNASPSTTGVGACVIGDYFFRATHDRLEAYNIRDITSIPTPESTATTPSAAGVGLAGR